MDLLRASMANLNKSPSGLKSHPLFPCVEPLRISRLHTQSPKKYFRYLQIRLDNQVFNTSDNNHNNHNNNNTARKELIQV